MQNVRNFLFDTDQPLWRYCLIAFPLAFVPSIALVVAVNWLNGALGWHFTSSAPHHVGTASDYLIVGVLGPALETCLLAIGIGVLSEHIERKFVVAGISALLWACLHGLFAVLWFFGVVWSFFIFSCAYMAWRKNSFRQGFVAAWVLHALNNVTILTLTLFWHF